MMILRFFRGLTVIFFLLSIMMSTACNTSKKAIEVPVEEERILAPEDYLNSIVQNQLQAEWLDGSVRLSYDDGSMAVGANASIKMQKDKVIWMSVKKFGFEIARAMITPDSLFILDRFNKEYAAEPLSYIEDRFNLPADLSMLQQILLGNPVFLTRKGAKAQLQEGNLRWSAQEGETRNDYWFAMPDYQLEQMQVEQTGLSSRSLGIQLLNYEDAGSNRDFSYLRKIAVNSQETGKADIEIEFTKVELNVPTDINFNVPSRYQRMSN